MTSRSNESVVVGGKLAFPLEREAESTGAVLRRSVSAVGMIHGLALTPRDPLSAAVLDGDADARSVVLTHPSYPGSESSPSSRISFRATNDGSTSVGTVFVHVALGEEVGMLGPQWEIGRDIMPRLVTALRSTLGFMTAWRDEEERPALPPDDLVPGSVLPREFLPWTYFAGPGLTDSLRTRLAGLPAVASRALGEGWLVEAVANPADEPEPAFVGELAVLSDRMSTYRWPMV